MAKPKTEDSVQTDNGNYVGVSPEYQNYANETDAPLVAESDDDNNDEAQIVEAFKESQEALVIDPNAVAGHMGYTPDLTHPSEATKPQDAYIDRNRAIHEGLAAQAEQVKAEAAASSQTEESDTSSGSSITGG